MRDVDQLTFDDLLAPVAVPAPSGAAVAVASRPERAPSPRLVVDDMASKMDGILGGGLFAALGSIFELMDWGEDEIKKAQRRHPGKRDELWHSFKIVRATIPDRMMTEFVYRAHARELLERVAAGQDTRPGTDVEMILCLSETSKLAPLTQTGYGLTFRLWRRQFGKHPIDDIGDHGDAIEELNGSLIDEAEYQCRRKLTQPERTLKGVECEGRHHGQTVVCRFHHQVIRAQVEAHGDQLELAAS